MYDAVLLVGSKNEIGGRNISGYRLRTAAEKENFNTLVIDCAMSMTESELFKILESAITNDTLVLGVSTVWITRIFTKDTIEWLNIDFFQKLKSKFPKLNIVTGGYSIIHDIVGAKNIYEISDWRLLGFSDRSFIELLKFLSGKISSINYFVDKNNIKTIDSNKNYPLSNPNDIETEFKTYDRFESFQPVPLELSRGCIFRCSFCNHPFQGKKDPDSYIRTADSIAAEIKRNYELFGTTRYSILDDTMNDSLEKLYRLSDAIEQSNVPNFEFQSYIKPEILVTKPEMIPILKNIGLRSAFVGIESMNDHARKVIGRGTKIEKVLEKLYDLKSFAKIHGAFIVGLPGDSLDDVQLWHNNMISERDKIFRSWQFSPLGIYKTEDNQNSSKIDNFPQLFGYSIYGSVNDYRLWKNKDMDIEQSITLSNKLNSDKDKMFPAGWYVSSCWNIGESNDSIDYKNLKELNIYNKSIDLNRQRALEFIKNFNYGI